MDEENVTNEEVSGVVSAWNGDTGTDIPVGQVHSQGAAQSPATPATCPGTGAASEISKGCAYPVGVRRMSQEAGTVIRIDDRDEERADAQEDKL